MIWESKSAGRLGHQLVNSGAISRLQLVEAYVLAKASGHPLEQVLLERGYVTQAQLDQAHLAQWRLVELA
jgi:hypothetical protein